MSHSSKIDRTFVGWARALSNVGLEKLAESYETDPVADFKRLRLLGLPIYDAHLLPVLEFLEKCSELQLLFLHDSYYMQLYPLAANKRKYSLLDFSNLTRAEEFIEQNISEEKEDYLILVSEYENNLFGGSIISYRGGMIVEITPGAQTGVSYGNTDVEHLVSTPVFRGIRCSTMDPVIKGLLITAAQAISKGEVITAGESLGANISPSNGKMQLDGYFEFAYTGSSISGPFRLVFFDAKFNDSYCRLDLDHLHRVFAQLGNDHR